MKSIHQLVFEQMNGMIPHSSMNEDLNVYEKRFVARVEKVKSAIESFSKDIEKLINASKINVFLNGYVISKLGEKIDISGDDVLLEPIKVKAIAPSYGMLVDTDTKEYDKPARLYVNLQFALANDDLESTVKWLELPLIISEYGASFANKYLHGYYVTDGIDALNKTKPRILKDENDSLKINKTIPVYSKLKGAAAENIKQAKSTNISVEFDEKELYHIWDVACSKATKVKNELLTIVDNFNVNNKLY